MFETIQKTFYPILCYITAELYNVLCCCSLLTIQISFFSSEVCRKVKQTVYGWPRDSTYTVCSSVTEDFNCFNLFVVKLFIKRFSNYFIHLDFFLIYHINDINPCKIIIQLLRESWVTFKKILQNKKRRKMKNPFIGTALLIWMQHVKHQRTFHWLGLKGRTNIHTTNDILKIIKNVLSFSLLILSITFPPKIFTHSKQKWS